MSSPNFPTIDRRAFLGGLGLSAIAVPLAAEAQQAGKVYRIGVLHSAARESERIKALEEGLRELGYVEGRNLVIEHRFADVKLERLGELRPTSSGSRSTSSSRRSIRRLLPPSRPPQRSRS